MRTLVATLVCLAVGCGDQLALPANDGGLEAPAEMDAGGEPSAPPVHDPVPSRVLIGSYHELPVGDRPESSRLWDTVCGYDRCLVVYGSDESTFGLWLRRPDGATISEPLELGSCTGPAASDGRGFAVLCDEGLVRVRADGTVRRLRGNFSGDAIAGHDGGYLIVGRAHGGLWSTYLEAGGDGTPPCCAELPDEPAGCDSLGQAGLHVVSTDAGPVVACGDELLLLSPRGDETEERVPLPAEPPAGCADDCQLLVDSAAAIGSHVLVGARWVEEMVGVRSAMSFRLDARTGDVVRGASFWPESRARILRGILLGVDESYYLAVGEGYLQRLQRDAEPVGDETSSLPVWDPCGYSSCRTPVAPLSSTRIALLDPSDHRMRIIDYEALDR